MSKNLSSPLPPNAYLWTRRTVSFPTRSHHPNISVTRTKASRQSKYFRSSAFKPTSSSAVRPSNCSQASVDHTSFPDAILPVSSAKVPTYIPLECPLLRSRGTRRGKVTRRGFILKGTFVSHCLHGAVTALAYKGTPQLEVVGFFGREEGLDWFTIRCSRAYFADRASWCASL